MQANEAQQKKNVYRGRAATVQNAQPVSAAPASPPAEDTLPLVRGAMRGDRQMLAGLCRSIAKSVLFRVKYLLPNHADAEDVSQEVLITVCEKVHTVKEPEAFHAWLNAVVMNKARQHGRQSASRGKLMYLSDMADEPPEENEDLLPQEYTLREEEYSEVMEIIRQLPQRQREAVMLYYYQQLSVAETAKVMGILQPNASRYLVQARDSIKQALQKSGARLGALALVPTGGLIREVFAAHEAQIGTAQSAAIAQAAQRAVEGAAAQGAAGVAAAAKLVAGIGGAIALGLVSAFMVVRGLAPPPAPQAAVLVQGEISFSGGRANAPAVNPTGVDAMAESDVGAMEAVSWRICLQGETQALYSGEGDGADATLASMAARGEAGDYELGFYMQDAAGNTGWLTKWFSIT